MHASDTRLLLFFHHFQLPARSTAYNRVKLARLLGRMMEACRFISNRVVVHAALVAIIVFIATVPNRCLLFLRSLLLLKRFVIIVADPVGDLPLVIAVLLGDEHLRAAFADEGPYLSRLARFIDLRVAKNLHRRFADLLHNVLQLVDQMCSSGRENEVRLAMAMEQVQGAVNESLLLDDIIGLLRIESAR